MSREFYQSVRVCVDRDICIGVIFIPVEIWPGAISVCLRLYVWSKNTPVRFLGPRDFSRELYPIINVLRSLYISCVSIAGTPYMYIIY